MRNAILIKEPGTGEPWLKVVMLDPSINMRLSVGDIIESDSETLAGTRMEDGPEMIAAQKRMKAGGRDAKVTSIRHRFGEGGMFGMEFDHTIVIATEYA
jgi:hypothetical protein